MDDLVDKLAKYELGWWKAHHRRDEQGLVENTARLYELLFNVTYETALRVAKLKSMATRKYLEAKKYDGNKETQEKANEYWRNAESMLKSHFKLLLDKKND